MHPNDDHAAPVKGRALEELFQRVFEVKQGFRFLGILDIVMQLVDRESRIPEDSANGIVKLFLRGLLSTDHPLVRPDRPDHG
jgi:hypothetical protein